MDAPVHARLPAAVLRDKLHKQVTVLRDLELTQFRSELVHANDPDRRYIVNFHRGPLFGKGGGSIATGRHIVFPKRADTPLMNLYLALFERMGAPTKSFGDSTGVLSI